MKINAFHPDYVKTYMPELLSKIKTESAQTENGKLYGAKSRTTRAASTTTKEKAA